MISRTGAQALKALAALADLTPGAFAGAGHLARQTGAPENYLGKLLRVLSTHGLLASQKGFGGGFRLARPAGTVTLFDVLQHLEPVARWSGCILGRAECSDQGACALHHRWAGVREAYLDFLRETTIADLQPRGRAPGRAGANARGGGRPTPGLMRRVSRGASRGRRVGPGASSRRPRGR
jgi:Rrf2 family transcriptional regulator, iron-sulfur cluster assembly transcription factor